MENNNKARFVRLDMVNNYIDGYGEKKEFKCTEWFCLDTTWTHPYNRRNDLAAEFQKWCKDKLANGAEKEWEKFGYLCCPNITCGGAPLHDGWGSDIDGRICQEFPKEDILAWGDKVEEALRTGEVQTLHLDNGKETLDTTFTPFATFTPDPESVAAFGEYADAALEGLTK